MQNNRRLAGSRRAVAAALLGLAVAGLSSQLSLAGQTNTYVMSWIVPAMYAGEDLNKDGEVTIDRSIERTRFDALSKVRRDDQDAPRLIQAAFFRRSSSQSTQKETSKDNAPAAKEAKSSTE